MAVTRSAPAICRTAISAPTVWAVLHTVKVDVRVVWDEFHVVCSQIVRFAAFLSSGRHARSPSGLLSGSNRRQTDAPRTRDAQALVYWRMIDTLPSSPVQPAQSIGDGQSQSKPTLRGSSYKGHS
jgi:hypothetical protein